MKKGLPLEFKVKNMSQDFIKTLETIIKERKDLASEESYIARSYAKGFNKLTQKFGEEAVEVIIAALAEDKTRLVSETADLIFHLLMLLEAKDVSFADIIAELEQRNKTLK